MSTELIDPFSDNGSEKRPSSGYSTYEKKFLLAIVVPGFQQWFDENLEEYNGEKVIRRLDLAEIITLPHQKLSDEYHHRAIDNFISKSWKEWESSVDQKLVPLTLYEGNPVAITPEAMVEFVFHLMTNFPEYLPHDGNLLSIAKSYLTNLRADSRTAASLQVSRGVSEEKDALIREDREKIAHLHSVILSLQDENDLLRTNKEENKKVRDKKRTTPANSAKPIVPNTVESNLYELVEEGYSLEHAARAVGISLPSANRLYTKAYTKRH